MKKTRGKREEKERKESRDRGRGRVGAGTGAGVRGEYQEEAGHHEQTPLHRKKKKGKKKEGKHDSEPDSFAEKQHIKMYLDDIIIM